MNNQNRMNGPPLYMAIDIGGSSVKYGVVDEHLKIIKKDKFPSKIFLGGVDLIKRVNDAIKRVTSEYDIQGVAIASTGIIDSVSAKVVYADDVMSDYTGTDFKKSIKKKFGLDATAINDVNALALSQIPYNKDTDFVVIALGTGIGGGIVISGDIYEGYGFSAGEFGLMHIRDGKNWEALCSVSSLVKTARENKLNVSNGRELFELYDSDNETALAVVDAFNKDMANAISNLIYSFAPRKIIIGGGISSRKEKLVSGIKHYLGIMMDSYYFAKTNVECAAYENDAAMIGAVIHHLNMKKQG